MLVPCATTGHPGHETQPPQSAFERRGPARGGSSGRVVLDPGPPLGRCISASSAALLPLEPHISSTCRRTQPGEESHSGVQDRHVGAGVDLLQHPKAARCDRERSGSPHTCHTSTAVVRASGMCAVVLSSTCTKSDCSRSRGAILDMLMTAVHVRTTHLQRSSDFGIAAPRPFLVGPAL